ncbi:MAG: hypothetical protein M3Q80_01645 [bacterium]|nr:hypothetical protein [bacterium]
MKVKKIWRTIEKQQGEAAETYFNDMLTAAKAKGKLPPWIVGWERHEKWSCADINGIDFTIKTDRGEVYFDIKSSTLGVKRFQNKNPNSKSIPIAVNILVRPETFLGKFISILGSTYRTMK